ncbi:MAG: hypothetical protein MK135_05070 [Polyangiaceae bacterium]|nr:hypothetical protein [Polyangiaceae bacterium]
MLINIALQSFNWTLSDELMTAMIPWRFVLIASEFEGANVGDILRSKERERR